jgi:UDP-N-acetylmuramoylalanine--D-glutamate ligase
MDFRGKKIVIIGMGRTGVAVARFLGNQGARVTVTDNKSPDQWGDDFGKISGEKWLEIGAYNADVLKDAALVVPSPGVPPRNELLTKSLQMNIPVISEIELAGRLISVPMIAVTGTNGKTTTTTLLGDILKNSGKDVFVGGNIGKPLVEFLETSQTADFVVAEISSFQLQWTEAFRPFIAVLLNVTRDHTDYHGSFDEYKRVKMRIFANQTGEDFAIVNAADDEELVIADSVQSRVFKFSSNSLLRKGLFVEGDNIVLKMNDAEEEIYALNRINLPGSHNAENTMAAIAAARICGCHREDIIEAVEAFRGLPHRIEFVDEKHSVRFYDDSKGTNVGAVLRALETFPSPVILLLGGRDKDGDFESLRPALKSKAKRIILFGEARERIASLIGDDVPAVQKIKLRDAVEEAYRSASPGDIVVLSPGCASFDEFTDYKERGNYFKDAVRSL